MCCMVDKNVMERHSCSIYCQLLTCLLHPAVL